MDSNKLALINFDVEHFLKDYWQQKPLLIRNAFDSWENPLTADELAGLACSTEQDIESATTIDSRIVSLHHTENSNSSNEEWRIAHGPFDDDYFSTLSENHWSLLVQSVDHYVQNVAMLRSYFDFLPAWRMDDVMVSYATTGGGVGPHFDRYDVFLIQGAGSRRWRIGQRCNANTALQPSQPINLLNHFEQTAQYDLNPGDILYLPPNIAHWGTALDNDCMTYSIGFRAPSHAQLFYSLAQAVESAVGEDTRYKDDFKSIPPNQRITDSKSSGQITAHAIKTVRENLQYYLDDERFIHHWLGKTLTESAVETDAALGIGELDIEESAEETDFQQRLSELKEELTFAAEQQLAILRDVSIRVAYIDEEASDDLLLFVDGEQLKVSSDRSIAFFRDICNLQSTNSGQLLAFMDRREEPENDQNNSYPDRNHQDSSNRILLKLFEFGVLYIDEHTSLG